MQRTLRPLVAEFLGVFTIVFVGSGSIMMNARSGSQAALLANAVSYAFTIAALVGGLSRVSGHFNPAISIAWILTRRTPVVDGGLKIAAQVAGGIVGAWLLSKTFPTDLLRDTRIGGTVLAADVTFVHAVVLEAVTTALLAITCLGVASTDARPAPAGIIIGFVVGAMIIAIGPLTGASFNPARSLGPALISGVWEAQAVYWIGPVLGAVGGALVWDFGLKERA